MKRIFVAILFLLSTSYSFGQVITPEQYIATYKDIAIREMKRMGVPASITLAQGLLETESGNSVLVKKSNNHFGIKCKSTWTAEGVSHTDDAPDECFRVYKTPDDSYRDHSNFLRGGDRYAFLFSLNPLDYKAWAYGLKRAGYATNNKYPEILIKNIEQYNLQQYSLEGAKDMPVFNSSQFQSDPGKTVFTDTPGDDKLVEDKTATVVEASDKTAEINGLKYVVGKKGTSLLAIASKYNINLSRLLEFNELGGDGLLSKDQIVFLQKKSKTGPQDFYISKIGETLYDAAQQNGIQLQSLITYNMLNESTVINPGTKLLLNPIVQNVSVKNDTPSGEGMYYEVKPKEGLYSIAKKFGLNVQQLKDWNNLSSDSLKIGQQLIISK